jgi:hypothetical protein
VFTPNRNLCDDGEACTTNDVCSGGTCVGTPAVCDDGNACNGVETCDPATGCHAGTPLACDDRDPCTDDSCEGTGGCLFRPKMGLPGADCRLDALGAAVASGSRDFIDDKMRRVINRTVARIDRLVGKAMNTPSERRRHKLDAEARARLRALGRVIARKRGTALDPQLADELSTAVRRIAATLEG